MTVTLAELSSRLQGIVSPNGQAQPSSAQYDQAIQDAVFDFGYRCPIEKQITVAVVAGQAEYAMPRDFVRLIAFSTGARSTGVIITGVGIIPSLALEDERVVCRAGKMTIYPTPDYTLERTLTYAAGFPWVPSDEDGDGEFTDLSDDEASIVMHNATALILQLMADGCARLSWTYTLADEQIDKTQLANHLHVQAEKELALYHELIAARSATRQATATQATYTPAEYGTFAEDIP